MRRNFYGHSKSSASTSVVYKSCLGNYFVVLIPNDQFGLAFNRKILGTTVDHALCAQNRFPTPSKLLHDPLHVLLEPEGI
jgi:hypothetical protein